MIIKSLLEIAFYSSLLVVKKVSSTLGENLPFSEKKKHKKLTSPVKIAKKLTKKVEKNDVTKKEKGTTTKQESKKTTPKEEAKIMNYELKSKKELYEIAQEIDIEGRSTMNKAQLLKALKEHSKK